MQRIVPSMIGEPTIDSLLSDLEDPEDHAQDSALSEGLAY
jgi:hypothetical protein